MLKIIKLFKSTRISALATRLKATTEISKSSTIMRVLNVAEKNDAAKNIAGLLSRGTASRAEGLSKFNKIYRFQCDVPQLNGRCDMTMTSVSGHLTNFDFGPYDKWNACPPQQLFDCQLNESVIADRRNQDIKKTLEREARSHQALIIWTDGDSEGENIGFEIIRTCCSVNRNLKLWRAKFSEITPRAMNIAINNLVEPNEHIAKAVDVRKELDLRFGAVFTRYQTMLLQKAGCLAPAQGSTSSLVSYGPCQFPTMGFVIDRYLQIFNFVPQPFWTIAVKDKRENIEVAFNWKRHRLFEENACLAFYSKMMECPKARVTSVQGKEKKNWRPEPMYTTSMEKLASTKLRITAKEALSIAEKLYTSGYISYPRTETNIFPKGMNLANIVEQQVRHPQWGNFAQRILQEGGPTPRQGKKTDNAHPPIHPTKFADSLHGKEASMYELITRHFLACVSKDALGAETTVGININGEDLSANGLIVLEQNYLEVYPYFKWNTKEIPKFLMNEEFVPDSIRMNDGKTCPPLLLTESELISLMEKHGIGTDATHADHIDKIQKREYVKVLPKNKRFCPTKLGLALYDGYHSMQFTHLIKPKLRSRLEKDLNSIAECQKQPRDVAQMYIAEHKSIYEVADRESSKLIQAFHANKNKEEPEQLIKARFPAEYR